MRKCQALVVQIKILTDIHIEVSLPQIPENNLELETWDHTTSSIRVEEVIPHLLIEDKKKSTQVTSVTAWEEILGLISHKIKARKGDYSLHKRVKIEIGLMLVGVGAEDEVTGPDALVALTAVDVRWLKIQKFLFSSNLEAPLVIRRVELLQDLGKEKVARVPHCKGKLILNIVISPQRGMVVMEVHGWNQSLQKNKVRLEEIAPYHHQPTWVNRKRRNQANLIRNQLTKARKLRGSLEQTIRKRRIFLPKEKEICPKEVIIMLKTSRVRKTVVVVRYCHRMAKKFR